MLIDFPHCCLSWAWLFYTSNSHVPSVCEIIYVALESLVWILVELVMAIVKHGP